jgi:hypothetical protein
MDPDSDTDRNKSTNVPISKLRIETKPKRFDVFLNLKWNVSIYSKNFGTKPKLFDVFQLLFCKSKTFLFFPKILEQTQNFLMCSNCFFSKSKTFLYNSKNFRSEREGFGSIMNLVSKMIFLGTLVAKRKQTIFKKLWFDITSLDEEDSVGSDLGATLR